MFARSTKRRVFDCLIRHTGAGEDSAKKWEVAVNNAHLDGQIPLDKRPPVCW